MLKSRVIVKGIYHRLWHRIVRYQGIRYMSYSEQPNVPKPRRHTRKHRIAEDGRYKLERPNRKSTISTDEFVNKSRELLNLIYFGVKEIEQIDDNVTIEYHLHDSGNLKDDKILNIHVETIGSYQVLIDDLKSQIQLMAIYAGWTQSHRAYCQRT
eukprot:638147_1